MAEGVRKRVQGAGGGGGSFEPGLVAGLTGMWSLGIGKGKYKGEGGWEVEEEM